MKLPIKTLVVGYGLSAKAFHLPFLQNNAAYAVVGIVQPRGYDAAQDFPQLGHYRSLEEALQQTDASLVVITTPNKYHAAMVRAALEAGRHVVVEKPFAVEVAEARKLVMLARQQQKVLSIYHNRRWDADFLSLQQLLREGQLGEPVMLVSRFDRLRPQIKPGWKEEQGPGTGIFHDLGPHLIDQALQLFGWPVEVYAHLRRERPNTRTVDAFDFFLYYPDKTVHLAAGSLVSNPGPRFSLIGTRGSYTKWGLDPQETLLRQGMQPTTADWGSEPQEAWGRLVQLDDAGGATTKVYPSQMGNYGAYYIKLADALRGTGKNPVTPEEALQVMQLIDLGYQSHQEGSRMEADLAAVF